MIHCILFIRNVQTCERVQGRVGVGGGAAFVAAAGRVVAAGRAAAAAAPVAAVVAVRGRLLQRGPFEAELNCQIIVSHYKRKVPQQG